MNKTKIVTNIGPATKDIEVIKELIDNGTNVIRLNLDKYDYAFCEDVINKVNEINQKRKNKIAVMLDTSGPTLRVGRLLGDSSFYKQDDKIRIYMNDIVGDTTKFSVNYPNLINDIKVGSIIKASNGKVILKVLEKYDDCILCLVESEGIINAHTSLNIPDIKLNIPFLSKKDEEDILFAHKMNVDFLALSFISSSEDVLKVNDMLINLENDHIEIISKIETEEAVKEIDNIINVSDGIMIARGDLGLQIPMERIPGIQKNIINKCHETGKVCIVATELMSSMLNEIIPTRAEVSDIANAVLDGADAVTLSYETEYGKYPVESVNIMSKIIISAEQDLNNSVMINNIIKSEKQDVTGYISYCVIDCANKLNCKAIVAPTISGYTAKKMSHFRPNSPIIALSPSEEVVKSLAIHFGVYAYTVDELKSFDTIMKKSKSFAIEITHSVPGDKIIITGGYPFKDVKHTNFMKIEEL